MKIYGPYVHNTGKLRGRKYVNIEYSRDNRTTKLYSRYLMEQLLGRELDSTETVDHINEDLSDDRLENLQVLSNLENIKKYFRIKRPVKMFTFFCPTCGEVASKPLSKVRHNRKQGKAGPYCSKACANKRT